MNIQLSDKVAVIGAATGIGAATALAYAEAGAKVVMGDLTYSHS